MSDLLWKRCNADGFVPALHISITLEQTVYWQMQGCPHFRLPTVIAYLGAMTVKHAMDYLSDLAINYPNWEATK